MTICRRTSTQDTEVMRCWYPSMTLNDIELLEGTMPPKQLKMLLGWAAFHQEELKENWELAADQQELFAIEPLK